MSKFFCAILWITAIGFVSFYVVNKYLFDERKKWIRIGTLKQIFIYPLDGGPGQPTRVATCREDAFFSNGMVDRSLIIFPEESNSAILHLETPELASQDIEGILNEYKCCTLENRPHIHKEINYLGDPIMIHQYLNYSFVRRFLGHLAPGLNIGYVSSENKKEFLNRVRSTVEIRKNSTVDIFSSAYSSYTLINTQSLQNLLYGTDGIKSISPNQFRPHFVIEGERPFCEDYFKSLKIGEVEFGNIVPCTHTDFINYKKFGNEKEPYATLQKFHSLKDVYKHPKFSTLQSPAFGINMELVPTKQGTIAVGDQIYAKI